MAAAAGDVCNSRELRKIISRQDGGDVAMRLRSHRGVEDATLLWMLGQVRESAARMGLQECGLPSAYRMFEVSPSPPEDRQADHADVVAHRAGVVAAQNARGFGVRPCAGFPLEDPVR